MLESVRQFISQSHTREPTIYYEFFASRNRSSKCLPSDASNGILILVVIRSPAVKIDGGARAMDKTMMVSTPVVSPNNLQLIRREGVLMKII